jgi:hypothetical protein
MGEYQQVKFWFSYIKVSIIIPLSLEVVRIEYISMRHQSNVILNQGLNGIVACKFNKPCEVEIIKLVLRSTISQLYSEIRSRK